MKSVGYISGVKRIGNRGIPNEMNDKSDRNNEWIRFTRRIKHMREYDMGESNRLQEFN